MKEFTLDQLRAILEMRELRRQLQTRGFSPNEPRLHDELAKVFAITDEADASFKQRCMASSIDPWPDIPSDSIFREMRERQKVIYGEDDRCEVIGCEDAQRRRKARSVCAVVERNNLIALGDGSISIGGATLADRYAARGKPLCPREAFRTQPSSAIGTAFLVAPTIVATAHHCLSETTVDHHCLIFDFETDETGTARTTFRAEQIYGIRRFITGTYTNDGEDWALVEVDREVTDREPLALRSQGAAADNLPLYVIGHPSGLPKKIAGNAEIRVNTAPSHFVANLDTYGGNSGSPVFNAVSHEVEGILVRGDTDFVPLGNCYGSLICPITGCRGEDCSRIEPITRYLGMNV